MRPYIKLTHRTLDRLVQPIADAAPVKGVEAHKESLFLSLLNLTETDRTLTVLALVLGPGQQRQFLPAQSRRLLNLDLFHLVLVVLLLVAGVVHMEVVGTHVLLRGELIVASTLYVLEHVGHLSPDVL